MQTSAELKELLQAAERREREADEQRRAVETAQWKQITAQPDSWEWATDRQTYCKWYDNDKQLNGLYVRCRIRPEITEQWTQEHNGKQPPNSSHSYSITEWHGMFYYRTDENILTHDGGGTCVLCDPKLCTDFEWAQLCDGIVLEKFKSRWTGGQR